ncbi:MAG: TonB-dependent receptor [Bacteroidales bacterium]|jgi:outer membrane receptor for ferrienterochelin and colicins|nr:TonB-dependent receptor [Bacteroidales bacterium]
MKKIIILILITIITLHINAQEKTDAMLFGHVKSESGGEHLSFANIMVKGTNLGTTSDVSGHFKLANLPLGKQTIQIQSLGYKVKEIEVIFEKGKSVELMIDLEDDVLNLEQVVITGTRTQHYVKDVPVRTEVITNREIENKNACNIYQALEGTPGIRVENQCQSCNFTMVRMQGLGAEHTQILINGQPMYSGLAGVYGLQQLSTIDVGRIEVVKGAGSALYGSSAIAGAINIITKEPSFVPSTTVGLQFGNYKSNRYDISSSLRNERGNIGLNIFAQRLTEDVIDQTGEGSTREEVKHKDGVSDRVATALTNAGFGLFVNDIFFKNDKLILRGKTIFERRQGGIITDDYYKNPFTDGTESIFTDRYEAELQYNKKFNKSEFNFSLAYVNHSRDATNDSFLNDYMGTHNDSVPDLRDMRPYIAKENSVTSALTYGIKLGSHNLLFGIQAFYDDLKETGMYVIVDTTSQYLGEAYKSTGEKSAKELGAFIQDEWNITSRLVVVPGVRFDWHNSGEEYTADRQISENNYFPKTDFNQTSFNPRIAVKYDISKKIILRANAGTGFRAPYGFSEDLHLCSGSPRVWKSSDLKPETSISYNFSVDYYEQNIKVNLNLFRTDLKDKIGFTDADPNIAALGYNYQWKNIDNAYVQGIELSVMTTIVKNLGIGIDFTYNHGKYKHVREDWIGTDYESISKYISRFPETTGNLKLEYTPKTWTFTILGNYQGSMYIDYYNSDIDIETGDQSKIKKTDPYMLFNARISKKIRNIKLHVGVNNIFNYIQDERHLDDAAFMYAPVYGTMFSGGITFDITH